MVIPPVTFGVTFHHLRMPKPYSGEPIPGIDIDLHGAPIGIDFSDVAHRLKELPDTAIIPVSLYQTLGVQMPQQTVEEYFGVKLAWVAGHQLDIDGWNILPELHGNLPIPKELEKTVRNCRIFHNSEAYAVTQDNRFREHLLRYYPVR